MEPGTQQPQASAKTEILHPAIAVMAGAVLVGIAAFLVHGYQPPREDLRLEQQVKQLSAQIQQIKQEQTMPAMVLNRYRDSICYIYGVYHVGKPGQRPGLRARVSGTGFV